MDDAFFRTTQEVLNFFGTDPKNGLTSQQVKEYRAKYGENGMTLKTIISDNNSTNNNQLESY